MSRPNDETGPISIVRVAKLAVTPATTDGLRSFAHVEVEFVLDNGMDWRSDSVSININFNVDRMSLDQVKDMAIVHAKSLMNRCVSDPHLKVGDKN